MKPTTLLKEKTKAWAKEVEATLRLIDDRNHLRQHKPPRAYKWVAMPREDQLLSLLNWKVWTMRYKVSLDFVMTFVLQVYVDRRKPSKNPWTLNFGLPVPLVTGVSCRKRLEEEVARRFPNGENLKAAKCSEPSVVRGLNYEDLDEMNKKYDNVMRQRHKPVADIISRRAYRKV